MLQSEKTIIKGKVYQAVNFCLMGNIYDECDLYHNITWFIGKSKKAIKLINDCIEYAINNRLDDATITLCNINKHWIEQNNKDNTIPMLEYNSNISMGANNNSEISVNSKETDGGGSAM